LLQILLVMNLPHPDPLLNIHHRISNGQINNWARCDVFPNVSSHRYSFYLATGETPESLLCLTRTTQHFFSNKTGRNYNILPVNRLIDFYFWCFNATFNNVSVISWRPVLVLEEAEVPGENHWLWASNWLSAASRVHPFL